MSSWKAHWFYAMDSPNPSGDPLVDLDSLVIQRNSWANQLTEEEVEQTNDLMNQITTLSEKGLTRTPLAAVFLKRRVQPLQEQAEPMWAYKGANDTNRIRVEEPSKNELESCLRSITRVKDSDPIDSNPAVLPFSAANPPTMVSIGFPFLS